MARAEFLARRARGTLIAAAGLVILLAVEWYLVFHVAAISRLDAHSYAEFLGLSARPHIGAAARRIADLCDPNEYVLLAPLPVVLALARRRPLVAGAILLILVGANLTTELLKPLAGGPRPNGVLSGISLYSWPSGHATASMSLALSMVLASPRRMRPYVAVLGAGFAVAVCYSFLTLGWHYPSDAVAGLLVASIWTLIGIAGVSLVDARRSRTGELVAAAPSVSRMLAPSLVAVLAALGLVVLAELVHPVAVAGYIRGHAAFVAAAVTLGGAGLSLPAAVALSLRGERSLSARGSGPAARAAPRRGSRRG